MLEVGKEYSGVVHVKCMVEYITSAGHPVVTWESKGKKISGIVFDPENPRYKEVKTVKKYIGMSKHGSMILYDHKPPEDTLKCLFAYKEVEFGEGEGLNG